MEKQDSLIKIIKDCVNRNKGLIKDYEKNVSSSLDTNSEIINSIKKDINNIISKDIDLLLSIVNDNIMDNDMKEEYRDKLNIIKTLLKLNKEGASISILEDDYKYLEDFLAKADDSLKLQLLKKNEGEEEYKRLNALTNKYKKILSLVKDDSNKTIIDDTETISILLKDSNISNEEKREIVKDLIIYNREVYELRKSNTILNRFHKSRVSEDDLIDIFKEFSYDFNKINQNVKEYFYKFSNLDNIREVFEALQSNGYPHILESRYSNKLFSLLVGSSKKTIDSVTEYAKSKGATTEDLLKLSGVLVEQKNIKRRNKNTRNVLYEEGHQTSEVSDLLRGSSIDFSKNVTDLEMHGINFKQVLAKCRGLFTISNDLLRTNLSIFDRYGFELKDRNQLCSPALSCLLSTHTADIADQFIEIHPLGLQYVRQNLSKLKVHTSAQEVFFYNVYKSMEKDENGICEGPFREDNNGNRLQMKGSITRLSPAYRDVEYLGINDENKKEKTNTIDVPIKDKEKYDLIIEENDNGVFSDDSCEIFDNERIQSLEEFNDENEPLAYDIDGVRISKLKVLRIYDTLLKNGVEDSDNAFMYAVTYNTIINEENYQKLDKAINKQKTGGSK